ncbi:MULTISPECIES: hypothetical protein [Bradyrhizobium]|uniref:hypothetical protein n=1 Tax=Bradyrhizobium TaxID=374 RepID=UPI00195CFF1F|nr:hypothetical protein [Bradyrhizobium canariense]MBM7486120.1 hypothetical protein [Bradyrhizobium canariense]
MQKELCAQSHREEGGPLKTAHFRQIATLTCDEKAFSVAVARSFCRHFERHLYVTRGLAIGLKFTRLERPADYPAENDRIVASLPAEEVRTLFEASALRKHVGLERAIGNRILTLGHRATDYGGELREWLQDPVEGWDKNRLCVLLDAFVAPHIDLLLFAEMTKDGELHEAFSSAVDWAAFEAEAAQHREAQAYLNTPLGDSEEA